VQRPLPPPKWKLSVVIWFCVYTCNLVQHEASMAARFSDGGWLELVPLIIAQLSVTVPFILYVYLPFLVSLQYRGLGLGPWLKMPHWQPPTPYLGGVRGFFCVVFAVLVEVANMGLALFNAPVDTTARREEITKLTKRLNKVQGRLDALKQRQYEGFHALQGGEPVGTAGTGGSAGGDTRGGTGASTAGSDAVLRQHIPQATDGLFSPSGHGSHGGDQPQGPSMVTCLVNHRVRWECEAEYMAWQEKIIVAMTAFPGYVSCRLVTPDPSSTVDEEEDDIYTGIFRFDELKSMQAWMNSAERMELLVEVQPYLASPDAVTATSTRFLPDAFTDLFVSQGSSVPTRPPPKWKVMVLTIGALLLVAWPVNVGMPRNYDRWGVDSPQLRMAISVAITVAFNTYCAAPFVMNLFGHWLTLPRSEVYRYQPWKTLDSGLAVPATVQFILIVLYLGAFILRSEL